MRLSFLANLKANTRKPVLKDDGAAIIGGLLPMLIGTALNLSGWAGWGVSYGALILLAKGMNWNNIARGATAVGIAHLGWTVGTPYVTQIFGHGPWRMGAVGTMQNSYAAMSNSDYQLMDAMTPGTSVATLPANAVSYPAAELASASSMNNSYAAMSNSYAALNDSMSGRGTPTLGRRR